MGAPLSPSSVAVACALVLGISLISYVFFIAASLALVRSRLSLLEEMELEGVFCAGRARRMVREADSYLLCAQFGRVLSSLASGCVLAVFSISLVRAVMGLDEIASFKGAFVVAVLLYGLVTSLILLVVQVIKAVSIQYAERVLCVVSLPLELHARVWRPILVFVHATVERMLLRLGIRAASEREVIISSDELGEIAKNSSEAGTLEKDEHEILAGVAELSERVAREVMTPRSEIVWIQETASLEEVLHKVRKDSVSRLLVCGSDLDDVRGVLLAKDLLDFVGGSPEAGAWRKFMRPAYRIPDTRVLRDLLAEMKQKHIHFSAVLNEHGEVVGVVTLEDLVEEIVGDIFDEFDSLHADAHPIVEQDGMIFLDGTTPVAELEERCGIAFPEGEYQTVGGFIQEHLGRIPVTGDSFSTKQVTVSVLEVVGHRVSRLSIQRVKKARKKPQDRPEGLKNSKRLVGVK